MHDSTLEPIRHPLLRGRQRIDGLWFGVARYSEPERQHLILSHWQTGARAYRFAEGDLLCFAATQSVVCEALAGWPLVRQGRALCSAPLEPAEVARLPAADVWLVRGSQVLALHLRDGQLLAPGLWLEVGDYPLLETFDCVVTLPAPVLLAPPQETDLRQILGHAVAAPDPQRAAMMQAMLERRQQQHQAQSASPPSGPSGAPAGSEIGGISRFWEKILLSGLVLAGLWAWIKPWVKERGANLSSEAAQVPLKPLNEFDGWLLALLTSALLFTLLLALLAKVLRRNRHGWGGAGPAVGAAPASPGISQRATPGRPKPAAWRRWLTRLTLGSRLRDLYGKRQAAYMRRMLDMFENGDLHEALRHAIPLGGEASGEQSFGTPQRREALTLSERRGVSRAMLFPDDMEGHLRQLYRQSFERLDREGRIEEAVFVLAELLHVRQEALDYLERHQRFAQAAELALAWDMSAALIVRLLCLADDWQRALQVARRDDAFSDAVLMLQGKWPEAADKLRLEWAEALTSKGLWLQAVDVVWSLPAERERAAQWLLNVEAAGGSLAAAALVKRAILLPDTLGTYRSYLQQLRDDPQRVDERAVLAQALVQHKGHASALAWLARGIVHAVLADAAQGLGQLQAHQLQPLVKLSNDKLLRNDLPPNLFSRPQATPLHNALPTLEWLAGERGSRVIFDAAPLDDERYLLALGEAGALVVDRYGKPLFSLAAPAWHIVLGHSRQVALVLARRDAVWRVSKLDLVQRVVSDLGVLVMQHFSRSFDGCAWTIGGECQVRVVDVDRGFDTLWHVSDLPGRLLGLKGDAENEYLLLDAGDSGSERWHYQLPGRRLLGRDSVPPVTDTDQFQVLADSGEVFQGSIKDGDSAEPTLVLASGSSRKGWRLPGLSEEMFHPPQVLASQKWLLIDYRVGEHEQRWHFISRADDRLAATLVWPQQSIAHLRMSGAHWLLFDREGRLCHINLDTSEVRHLSIH